jgi:hypothetical protein
MRPNRAGDLNPRCGRRQVGSDRAFWERVLAWVRTLARERRPVVISSALWGHVLARRTAGITGGSGGSVVLDFSR